MHLSYKPLYQLPRAIYAQKFGWGKLVIFASGQSFHNILPGVRNPQGLYEAWWDEPQQWTSLLLSLHSDFPNAFPGICGCVKVCSRYCTNCQGQFMHNKSGVLSPCGPCGAWWSRALVAGTSVLGFRSSGGTISCVNPPGTKYGTFGPKIGSLCALIWKSGISHWKSFLDNSIGDKYLSSLIDSENGSTRLTYRGGGVH